MSSKIRCKGIHKYERVQLSQWNSVWRCAASTCTHFMPQHMAGLMPGKASICWGCGNPLLLDEDAMLDDRPKCATCHAKAKLTPEQLIEQMKAGAF